MKKIIPILLVLVSLSTHSYAKDKDCKSLEKSACEKSEHCFWGYYGETETCLVYDKCTEFYEESMCRKDKSCQWVENEYADVSECVKKGK